MNVKIFKNPWRTEFIQLLESSQKKVQLASPFIKSGIAKLISQHTPKAVKVDLLNNFQLPIFRSGASDLEALNILQERGARLKNFQSLHAKIFIFDNERSVITSSNLTSGGLIKNYEYGVLIDDRKVSAQISDDFKNVFNNKELTGTITKRILKEAEQILESMPVIERARFEIKEYQDLFKNVSEESSNFDRLEGGFDSIQKTLKGWTKDVFTVLNQIDLEVFKLADVYKYEKRLKERYPNNKFVKDQIRKQLQILRDLGLLQFLDSGVYRKLWK